MKRSQKLFSKCWIFDNFIALSLVMIYANNPSITFPGSIDLSLNERDLDKNIKDVVRSVMKANEVASEDLQWTLARDEDISIEMLCGGITNRLYLVFNNAFADAKVILRTFGRGTELYIDRDAENTVFAALSIAKFGPPFHGLVQGGRVEGYIPSAGLHPSKMKAREVFPLVAKAVSDLHGFDVPAIKTEGIWLWNKINQFFNLISKIRFEDAEKAEKLAAFRIDVMLGELATLQQMITGLNSNLQAAPSTDHNQGRLHAFELALCHNDLLSGNILLYDATKHSDGYTGSIRDVYLIDYEYAAYNYRAFDIGNHFCEFGGFDFDIVNEFPSEDVRREFIEAYLRGHSEEIKVTDGFVQGFHDVVLIFCLASNLFWGSWAVVQSSLTTLDFDYIGYAKLRFDGYFYQKDLFRESVEKLKQEFGV